MSNLLPHSPPPARRRRGLWILLSLVVIALVIVVAGFFFARRQIGEFFAGKLGERLAEDGVFIAGNPPTGCREGVSGCMGWLCIVTPRSTTDSYCLVS